MSDDMALDDAPATVPGGNTDDTSTEKSEISESEKKFVQEWCSRIKKAKKFYEKDNGPFKRMDYCMQLAKDGAEKEWLQSGKKYVVPIVNRHINQAVSQLYAKNPKAVAKRKQRRMFTVWDGQLASLKEAAEAIQRATQEAQMAAQAGAHPDQIPPPDPNMVAILQDAEAVKKYNIMVEGIADTLTILHNHFMSDVSTQYKQQFKALVRRTKVNCIGYVKLGFQRILEKNPDVTTQIDTYSEQLATLRELMEDASEPDFDENSAKAEQLKRLIEDLQQNDTVIVKEGPLYSFPRSKSIIIDPAVEHLKTLAGANWIAEEYSKTPEEIEKLWQVDVKSEYTAQKADSSSWAKWSDKEGKESDTALVWRVMNRETGQEFFVCDGYPGYLQPPAPPKVKLRRFFDIFPLVFNEVESEDDQFPPSDVWLARHLQNEYNRNREGLREHRRQNRPAYIAAKGSFEETDMQKMASHESGAIIELNQMQPGDKIADKLQAKPVMQIDPKMYEVDSIFQDLLRVVGTQQANLGPTADATATESSIAEQSRTVSLADNVDDLDDLLSVLAESTGELMLQEMSTETVKAIVGPGAVWPEMPETREDIIEEIMLDIRAGSSGRPNQAADLAKMERAMPFVLQLPGVNPIPWGQKYLDLLDVDAEDAIVEGLPSITAVNAAAGRPAAAQPGTGDPQSDPAAQGPQGAQNAPQQPGTAPGPQPGFPAPEAHIPH
ncbi:hypothetical protein ABIE87_006464 [Bradyrhizobium diazoefficiens]|jgi:hypothetical protein|uniref:hypothetical protein n=1 Tax=Bradyrhizobium diazoefficiens TaxID=1355477 RepID=UPI0035138318